MDHDDMLDDIQECIDAMGHALAECRAGELSVDELWADLDAACQDLSALSVPDPEGEDEAEDEDDDEDDDGELDFDTSLADEGDDFDDEDGGSH